MSATPGELFDLSDRVAVVTGASSGLGQQFALTLAAAGANVVAVARREPNLIELSALSPRIDYVVCDVTDDTAVVDSVQTIVDRHGRVDVLVNNAGTTHAASALEEPLERFREVLEANLISSFHLAQQVGRHMVSRGSGSIINVASIHGLVSAAPNPQASYCASKGGAVSLTRELAVQWARHGVRVNALAPGYFPSELTAAMLDDGKGRAYVERKTPLGRAGRGEELAGTLLLLASDAGSYLTGQVIAVDGGWTAW